MAVYTALRANTGTAPATAQRRARDPLLFNDNSGAWRFLADFEFDWCYSAGSPVPAGALVRDMSERANGQVLIASGGAAPIIAGNGLDFSTVDRGSNGLEIPASVLTEIIGNSRQYFVMTYLKLPTGLNWAVNRNLIISTLFTLRTNVSGGTIPQLIFGRQDAGGAFNNLVFSSPTSMYGALAQVAFWRDGSATGFRIRTPSGLLSSPSGTPSRGADNTDVTVGTVTNVGTPSWPPTYGATELTGRNMRLFRIGVAIPQRLVGSYADILDADWNRTVARGVFS